MGAAVKLGVQLANQLVAESDGLLQSHVRTYSVPVNMKLPTGHVTTINMQEQPTSTTSTSTAVSATNEVKYNSALSIIVFSGALQ
jgi:hypothetical protein